MDSDLEKTMLSRTRIARAFLALTIFGTVSAFAQATLEIKDYLTLPMTGLVDGKGSNDLLLSRVNTLREEAGGSRRFFISDLNGLYTSSTRKRRSSRSISISTAIQARRESFTS
jgi:hypothetical protein